MDDGEDDDHGTDAGDSGKRNKCRVLAEMAATPERAAAAAAAVLVATGNGGRNVRASMMERFFCHTHHK